ncbi:MAG: YggT family protein [Peptococcaceae bacterium]
MIYFFLRTAVSVMNFLIIIRCFLSFIPHDPYNSILRYVYEITDPVLEPCSRLLPESLRYPMDFTPMVALLVIQVLYQVLVNVLHILF